MTEKRGASLPPNITWAREYSGEGPQKLTYENGDEYIIEIRQYERDEE